MNAGDTTSQQQGTGCCLCLVWGQLWRERWWVTKMLYTGWQWAHSSDAIARIDMFHGQIAQRGHKISVKLPLK